MRNPFKLAPKSDAARPSLRERLKATKARAKQVLAVNAVILKGPSKLAPTVDRAALVNYSSWLHWERVRVCAELHPHLGTKATGFVLGLNAAERFFWPHGIGNPLNLPHAPVPAASTRAVKVLDFVGVDWRADAAKGGLDHVDAFKLQDDGTRPALPYGWPAPDAALTAAVGDVIRITAAINALPSTLGRDFTDLPEYEGMDEAVGEAISTIVRTRAEGLTGLQAKARAILSDRFEADDLGMREVAESLARDLLLATNATILPGRDPIFRHIEEGRRLLALSVAAYASGLMTEDEQWASAKAATAYCDNVILETVPTTAAGCIELARYACDFERSQGVPIADEPLAVFKLMARCPAL